MTGKLHRALVLIAGIIIKVGAIVVITDPSALGIGGETWTMVGAWLAFGGSIASDIATVIRGDQLPGITTGIGNEIQGSVQTTTIKQETTTTP